MFAIISSIESKIDNKYYLNKALNTKVSRHW